jgi:LacI family transcriptional regulator
MQKREDTITLKTLAKELNLSTSTVSRALKGSHEISEQTQKKVKALADKLGYSPNFSASSLRQSKSRTIAVIIPEIENTFFSQAMNGIEEVAQKKGYHVLIYLTNEDFLREREILKLLRNGRVDGVMISVSNTTDSFEHLQELINTGIPLVCFDRVAESIDAPRVTTDDLSAAQQATQHLISQGARKIAFLSMSSGLSISNQRKHGYLKAIQQHDRNTEPIIIECGTNDQENRKAIQSLLKQKQAPDAIFAAVEKLAINTYEVCHELGIRIPEQLKVISFSNLPAVALFNPALSTIVQPAYQIGKEAGTILFKLIEKKPLYSSERKLSIPSKIIDRQSTQSS